MTELNHKLVLSKDINELSLSELLLFELDSFKFYSKSSSSRFKLTNCLDQFVNLRIIKLTVQINFDHFGRFGQ